MSVILGQGGHVLVRRGPEALMADHAGFLRAIIDDPDDDTHGLVYADWLEEQGDAARADYLTPNTRLVLQGTAIGREAAPALRARFGDAVALGGWEYYPDEE